MSSILHLNSRDAETPENTNEDMLWIINKPRLALLNGFKITLESAELINGVYPINEYYDTVNFVEAADVDIVTATLTPSNYTGSGMATHLAAVMTTASAASGTTATYTGSYDTLTKKITISSDSTFAWRTATNSAYEALGITTLTAAVAASVAGDFPINLSGSAYVDVLSSTLSTNNHSTSGGNVLARIPLIGAFGDVIQPPFPENEPIQVSTPGLSQIHLYLRDDQGNPWKLPGNMHISFSFRIDPLINPLGIPHSANNTNYNTGYASLGALARV